MLLKLIEYLKKEDWSKSIYQGLVVANKDPDKLGRIKCKVKGLIESNNNDKLPWLFPLNSYGLGGRVDLSNFVVPEISSEVVITFPYRDIYSGFYIGYWQNTPNTHQTLFDEDYPESYGWIDSVIQWVRINKSKPYLEYFRQSLQDMIRLDEEGNLLINIPKSLTIKVNKDIHLEVTNDFNEKIGNNKNIQTIKDINCKIGGNYSEDVIGDHGLRTGGTHGVESSGNISHEAPKIDHNSGIVFGTVVAGAIELNTAISSLGTEITILQNKLDELKTLADNIKTKRDSIKSVLKAKADNFIGS